MNTPFGNSMENHHQWHSQGDQGALDSKKNTKSREKEGENQEKMGKNQAKEEKSEGSFTLPLLTDRAGYTTEHLVPLKWSNIS